MNDPGLEASRWYRQAENDLAFAKRGLEEGYYSQVCFLCQQSGEKAVKSIHYHNGERFVPGHSIHALLKKLEPDFPEVNVLLETGGLLDQFYIPTRYPNGLPEGAPYEIYTQMQAKQAVDLAQKLLDFAKQKIS
jgi:HEPN domain-containing protein